MSAARNTAGLVRCVVLLSNSSPDHAKNPPEKLVATSHVGTGKSACLLILRPLRESATSLPSRNMLKEFFVLSILADSILQATGPASPLLRALKNLEEAIIAESGGGERETREGKRATTIKGEGETVWLSSFLQNATAPAVSRALVGVVLFPNAWIASMCVIQIRKEWK